MYELKLEDGSVMEGDKDLSNFWLDYFSKRWNVQPPGSDDVILYVIPKLISDTNNEALIRPFSVEEVEQVINDMPCDKSPGPDGLSGAYYKFSCDIIKKDFMEALNQFYVTK